MNSYNTKENYDAFISYRREGGSDTARSIKESLEKRGLKIFLDFDELKTGRFDEKLLNVIEETPSFLIILSKGSLDRCSNEDDWVKQEILQAIKAQRNIIPIVKKGFDFNETKNLPTDISEITRYNAINYDDNYYNAFIDELILRIGSETVDVQKNYGPSRKGRQKAKDIALDGKKYLKLGKYEEASLCFKEAHAIDLDSSLVYYGKGILSLIEAKNHNETLDYFQKASTLDPTSAYLKFSLSQVACFFGSYTLAIESLKDAIAIDPTNDEYRALLDEWIKKDSGRSDTNGFAYSGKEEEAFRIAKLIIAKEDDGFQEVRWWITALPPWSLIRKFPLLGSSIISIATLIIILIVNYNELFFVRFLQMLVISALCFLGTWGPFIFQDFLNKLYEDLKASVSLPQSSFKRWFLSESTAITGQYFQRASNKLSYRHLLKEDKQYFTLFILSFWLIIPLQVACAYGFEGFYVNYNSFSRYLYYFLQVYLLIWIPPFVIKALIFISGFVRLPIRYFVGMPSFLSLKPLGIFYLKIAGVGAVAFFLFTLQHYLFRTHESVTFFSVLFIISISSLFFGIMFFSQILITYSMIKHRQRKIVDYSYHIEETFRQFMENPDEKNFAILRNHKRNLNFIKKELSIAGLPQSGYVWFAILSLVELSIVFIYFYLVTNNLWI